MTIKNILESRGWSCDWGDVNSGRNQIIKSFSAKKKGFMKSSFSLTELKKQCIKIDTLNLKNKI